MAQLETSVCVVGAGPAGLVVVNRLVQGLAQRLGVGDVRRLGGRMVERDVVSLRVRVPMQQRLSTEPDFACCFAHRYAGVMPS